MRSGSGTSWFAALLLFGVAAGEMKRWRHDTEWSNGENWSTGFPPAPEEVAVIGGEDGVGGATVALPPGRVRVRALVLANQGALLLPRDGALVALGPRLSDEDAFFVRENHFIRSKALPWLDPEAWAAAGGGGEWSPAVPHAERVPCRWERVQLPGDAAFAVRLPALPLTVAGVRIGTRALSASAWRWLQHSAAGDAFVLRAEGAAVDVGGVVVRAGACDDPAGCPCNAPAALAAAVEEQVCALVRPRCLTATHPLASTRCLAPVKPRGHCCSICGAFLELRVERGHFRLAALRRMLRGVLDGDALASYASRLPDGRVQVVLAPRSPDAQVDILETGLALRAALLAEAELGVLAATLVTSGPLIAQSSWLRVAAPALGTLAAAVVVISGIFVAFAGWRSLVPVSLEQGGSFLFARFENTEADEAVEVVASPMGTSQSFDNPLYKQKSHKKSGITMQYRNLQEEDGSEEREATNSEL